DGISASFETIALESFAQEIVGTAAKARDTDPFSLERLDVLNLRLRVDPKHGAIKTAEGETQGHAAENCGQSGAAHGSKISISTNQSGYAQGVPHYHQIDI